MIKKKIAFIWHAGIGIYLAVMGTALYGQTSSWQKFERYDTGFLVEGSFKKNIILFEIRSYKKKKKKKKGERLFYYSTADILKFSKTPEELFDKLKPHFGSKADLPQKSNAFFIDRRGKTWQMDMIKDVESLMTKVDTPSELQLALWLHGKQEGYRYRKKDKGYEVDISYQKKGICGSFQEKVFVGSQGEVTQLSMHHSQEGCKTKKHPLSVKKKTNDPKIPDVMMPIQEPTSTRDWLHVSVGGSKIYAIKKSGALWEFRKGRNGHTFVGSKIDGNWHAVCANFYDKVMAVKKDGTLWGFGRDLMDLESGKTVESSLPVSLSSKKDWKGACCSGLDPEAPVIDNVGEPQIFCVGLKKDGSLWEWDGYLGDYTDHISFLPRKIGKTKGFKYIAVGYASVIAMKKDGSKWAIGHNGYDSEPRLPENKRYKKLTKVKHSTKMGLNGRAMDQPLFFADNKAEIKKNGTLWMWIHTKEEEFSDGSVMYSEKAYKFQEKSKSRNWRKVNIHGDMAAAIKKDGTLWLWIFR